MPKKNEHFDYGDTRITEKFSNIYSLKSRVNVSVSVINTITEMNFPKRPEIVKSQHSKSQVVAFDFQDQVSVFIVRENKIRIAAREAMPAETYGAG